MSSIMNPVDGLTEVIGRDILRSREDAVCNRVRSAEEGFYIKALLDHGNEYAEQQLSEWATERRLAELCGTPLNVAYAMLALARVDVKRRSAAKDLLKYQPMVRVIDIDDRIRLSRTQRYTGGKLYFADNPTFPGCGCSQPKGSYVFGRGGELGLRHIAICVDAYVQKAELLLFLPHPEFRKESTRSTAHGFGIITVTTEGMTYGEAISHYLVANPLKYALGEVTPGDMIRENMAMSGASAVLDFPGADDYFERHIASLPEYLNNVVDKLNGVHEHD